jgi:hypothetical protein
MSSGNNATVAGGIGNTNTGYTSATGGGYYNTNSGYISTVAGGGNNISSGIQSTVGGGALNTSSGFDSTVGGGSENIASAQGSTVAGGLQNISSNFNATVPGGRGNIAGGIGSFAAGSAAQALNDGAFVWADTTGGSFTSTANNQFLIRAAGGVGINTSNPVTDLHVNGTVVIQGALSPVSTSSSNLLNLLVGGGSLPVATNGSLNGISFYEGSAAKAMSLGYDGSGSSSVNALRIYGSTDTPLFSFLNGGSMGLGTPSPATALHVKAPSDTQISVESSDVGAHRWTLQSSRVAGSPATDASFQIIDRTLNVSRLLIGTNGNVGIGKTAPATALDVNGIVTAGGFLGSGSSLTNVNATTLGGVAASNVWSLGGNNVAPGQFLGSTNFQAVELWVNRVRGLRLEPTVNDFNHTNIVNVIAGSPANTVLPGVYGATIAGGGAVFDEGGSARTNLVIGDFGTIGGGNDNQVDYYCTVAGGYNNIAADSTATVGGGAQNSATNGSTVAGGISNTANGPDATVAGGVGNTANGYYATVGGGNANLATNTDVVVAGGEHNIAGAQCAAVGGGFLNNALGDMATIAGGSNNLASAFAATVGGGRINHALNLFSTVGGGFLNLANGVAATVGGGAANSALGYYSTVAGGSNNTALGDFSAAAGRRARANHTGTFVWADSTDADFTSSGANQFLIRASGGVGIGTTVPSRELEIQSPGDVELGLKSTDAGAHLWTLQSSSVSGSVRDASFQIIDRTANISRLLIDTNGNTGLGTSTPTNKLHVIGGATFTSGSGPANAVVWTPGSGAWSFTSDRNAKERLEPVDPEAVLDKVSRLPITEWNYKGYSQRHIGAMAQDFHAEFPLNESDTTLNDADLHGVTLAAIQGLNRKLHQSEAEMRSLKEQNESLRNEMETLKTAVASLAKAKAGEATH